ncbi:MAG: hypothetical protein R6W90_14210 [Ignavibacteriaceae bacterium]
MTEKEFITNHAGKLWADSIKKFPDDFHIAKDVREIELPGKALVIGEEFFGAFEILTVNGNPVYHADNHEEAKFIIYANREKTTSVYLPNKLKDIKAANLKYESYLDSLIKDIESEYRAAFPGLKNQAGVVNEIFRALNLTRY